VSEWQNIETAPKDGARFHGKGRLRLRVRQMPGSILPGWRTAMSVRVTWWGKASHVPLYGWCRGTVENVDLWEPTHWKPFPAPSTGQKGSE
jgi:hypothetical protein